jgi:acetyl esterase
MTTSVDVGTYPETERIPPDPEVIAFLAEGAEAPPAETVPIAEMRESIARQVAARPKLNEPVAAVADRTMPGPHGEIPLRLYTPAGAGPFPILLYLHGGGWVMGNLETHDDLCRSLCRRAGALVVAVDYRLAPEHPFPVALDESCAALAGVVERADEIGGDPARLAVAGDSAGGNLAAALALRVRDAGGPALALQVLIYPALNYAFDTASYHELADGYGLTRPEMIFFWNHYLASPADGEHPYASPLRAPDLSDLPPALVITAGYDPLRDDGEAYAARLARAGTPARLTRYAAMNHGFVSRAGIFAHGRRAIDEIAGALRESWD